MSKQNRAKSAFLTHRGLYVINVMPLGLCNAYATFKQLIEVLGDLVNFRVLIYFDDVLSYAEYPEELIELLRKLM